MKDNLFNVRFRIGEYAGPPDLRSGACRCRHRYDWRNGTGIGACPPVANIFKIPDRPVLAGHKSDKLSKIKAGAATKGNHSVMAAVLESGDASGEIDLIWIRVNITEQGSPKPGSI